MTDYVYDRRANRYRNVKTGRFASRANLLAEIDRELARSNTYLKSIATELVDGEITLASFQIKVIEELKRSHIRLSLLAAGGENSISRQNLENMQSRLDSEYEYLRSFIDDIESGNLTRGRIVYRAGLYAYSSRKAFYESERTTRIENGATLARRALDPQARHCRDCPNLSTQGKWLPIEVVVVPGAHCLCRNYCRCTIAYK